MADQVRDWQYWRPKKAVMNWLLDADPAIRWQVMSDVFHAPEDIVAAERARVAKEGWGARLLSSQAPDGRWEADLEAWPLKHTLFTLVLLKDFGLDPTSSEARRSTDLVRERVTWQLHDGRPFFDGETEPCINGRVLGVGAYFGEPSERLVDRLLGEQLEDGGWNCKAPPSRRSSFHSTICVLEGLLAFEQAKGADAAVTEARNRAQAYLMDRGMFRFLTTGQVIDRSWMRFSFPPTWHYDILRGLDYLRSAGVNPDERIAEAVAWVAKRRHQNGRWPLQNPHPDRIGFDMEGRAGTASRWNTLRALRVLDWYSAAFGQEHS